ncbi:MAG: hypothetical protein U0T82_09860 [Bacteroidales bacterium]
MTKKIPILLLVLLLLSGAGMVVSGQEKVHISTDREIYFSGDILWYRPWILPTGIAAHGLTSRIVYLELLNQNNAPIVQQKADLWKSGGAGCFTIPPATVSGNYILRAYTNVNRNQGPESFFAKHIIVINPGYPTPVFQAGSINSSPTTLDQVGNESTTQNLEFQITGKGMIFRPGQTVDLEILTLAGNKPVSAELSVSVALQLSNCPLNPGITASFSQSAETVSSTDSNFLSKEYETDYISGFLEHNGKGFSNQDLYFSVPGENNMVMVLRTSDNGKFNFPVSRLEGEQEILLSISDSSKGLLLSLDEEFDPRFSGRDNFSPCIDSIIPASLNSAFLEWQIRRNYGLRNDTVFIPLKETFQFFGKADVDLNLKEYAELPSMEEVFFELVKQVMVLKRKKETSLAVIDRETNRTLGDHILYLLDGVPVFSTSDILELVPAQVSRIQVVARPYYLGTAVFDGIISIATHGGARNSAKYTNFSAGKWIKFAMAPALFWRPAAVPENYPDFRPLRYWNSSIHTGAGGKAMIHFTVPDAAGTYQIMTEGIGAGNSAGRKYFLFRVAP